MHAVQQIKTQVLFLQTLYLWYADFLMFHYRSLYCLHIRCLIQLSECPKTSDLGDEPSVEVLSIEPFLIGVYDGTSFDMIKKMSCGGTVRYHSQHVHSLSIAAII